ncbi:ArnT family glycosyltransferase [Lysobacter sp.]|uniref:ArnT family glycosyltransferase n=1 Tax=Lysobacter sp. TaxID=72226 RepID=UPI002D5F9400|nr:glycosyltransferase family 39 protein [Lysobacter sp.]HZX75686.1 glycosyltransferase family 39 protein [Lysobacter sp.]
MRDAVQARRTFWVLWVSIALIKLAVAARLPLFVDEAFYWQEGQHLAAAYSDLPGLTAWLTRLGVEVGGDHTLALRLPFLIIAACVPLLMVHVASREFGAKTGWQAGILTLLLPLAGTLGLMALPDAAMALATLLCLDAGARLLRQVSPAAALELAAGLALGALCHYRFIAVIAVGFIALLMLEDGRRALRDVRVMVAIAFGASAWAPLVAWNLDNADAGLRFQLVDRHPWAFHADGILFIGIQALLVTPLLFAAMFLAARRSIGCASTVSRYFALLGAGVVTGFFALGFFADTERVSFHWPLPGYLALLPLVPGVLATWPRGWRIATMVLAGAGLAAQLAYYVAVSNAKWRESTAAEKWYPSNFAGWKPLADAVRERLAAMPTDTRIVADNFKIGAELGFALGDHRIRVLDHPINHKHGRAPQLRLWNLHTPGREAWSDTAVLLVVGASEVKYRDLLDRYHELCAMVGPLPPPQVLNIDHGRQRFLLFALEGQRASGLCTTPSMAWIDAPTTGARVGRRFDVHGWAFKDGTGLAGVEITLDGGVVAKADYGRDFPGLQRVWPVSNDPQHPKVGFDAKVDLTGREVEAGRHWLGLRLIGRDGSVETWSEQPVVLEE